MINLKVAIPKDTVKNNEPIINNSSKVEQTMPQMTQSNTNYVTKQDFTDMFTKFQRTLEPESALSPEVRSTIKAVQEVQGLRTALQSPTTTGIEQSMATFTTGILDRALVNVLGGGQGQQVAAKPLINSLAEIATHNISANLPQVLESLKSVLGVERIQKGYDAGLSYVEQKSATDFPSMVMSLDENINEHITYYAQQMGFTNFDKAKNALIEHKVTLYQEQQEYQKIQQGENQKINTYIEEEPKYVEEEQINVAPVKIQIDNKKNKIQLKVKSNEIENIVSNESNTELDIDIDEIYADI